MQQNLALPEIGTKVRRVERAPDQKVEAFSAPRSLLAEAARRAIALKMTKAGYYRYCLALELNYSEAEARKIAEHGAVRKSRERLASEVASGTYPTKSGGAFILNEEDKKNATDSGGKSPKQFGKG